MAEYSTTTLGFGSGNRQLYYRKKSSDEAVMKQSFADQQYNLNRIARCNELMAFAKKEERKGRRPLVIDAGANIGLSALYFLGNMPTAHVVAIEPDLENFKLLEKNVGGLDVEIVRGAVSSTTGRARVVDPGRGHWAYRTEALAEDIEFKDAVPRVTLNDIYESNRSKFFPFIVKVDVEGAEEDLFSGPTEWIASTPIVIVELHDWMFPKTGKSRPFRNAPPSCTAISSASTRISIRLRTTSRRSRGSGRRLVGCAPRAWRRTILALNHHKSNRTF